MSGCCETETIKVHGIARSTATQRVLACLYEKGLKFDLIPVDMKAKEHKTERFLGMNPFGQVPVVEIGDLKLFESRAITQSIAHGKMDKGNQLISSTPKLPTMAVWTEVEVQKFDPPASKLVWEICVKPMLGQTTDPAVVQEKEKELGTVLDVYERRLTQSKYIGDDMFTLADLHHLPMIGYLMGTQCKTLFESRPHVKKWVADITARPAWKSVVALAAAAPAP